MAERRLNLPLRRGGRQKEGALIAAKRCGNDDGEEEGELRFVPYLCMNALN
jgi:hypothetical protein